MPTYDYVCLPCKLKFEDIASFDERLTVCCPKCGQLSQWLFPSPHVIVAGEHRADGPDGDIPMGQLRGDEDYDWQKEGKDFGPLP